MRINRLFFFSFIVFFCPISFALTIEIPNSVVPCSNKQCETLAPVLKPNEELTNQAIVFQTSRNPEFMARTVQQFSNTDNGGWQHITINESEFKDVHPIIGFGGSFTDAAAILYQHMSPELKKALIDAYFSPQGIGYSSGRVPIASNDFSCRHLVRDGDQDVPMPSLKFCSPVFSSYSYEDNPDPNLSNFSLQTEDINFKIPMIHAAFQAAGANTLRLFASPWSAPAWMKTNKSMVHGSLDSKFQQAWANYIVKFLQGYKQNQVTFWGITIQNEPVEGGLGKDLQPWQTMYFTQDEEANFLKDYLGPTIRRFENEYGSKINIMMHDDQIMTIKDRVAMLNDSKVSDYVDGAGLHWYTNIDLFYPNLDSAYKSLNKLAPERKRFILGTEACEGYLPTLKGPLFGSWARGESYGHDIIKDLNHYVSGWNDWNLILDMEGGPNWAQNYVDAPILFDLNNQTFYRQPMYYYMGHFSRFIRPESRLLASKSEGPAPLEEVSYHVPAHDRLPETIVIVVLNRDITGRNYFIKDNSIPDENKYLNMQIPAHSIQTIIYKARA